MAGLSERLLSIPPITRFFTIVSIAVCLAGRLNVISFERLLIPWQTVLLFALLTRTALTGEVPFDFDLPFIFIILLVILQGYRFFSWFFVPAGIMSGEGATAMLEVYFFYNFSNHLESSKGKFMGNFPDYLWFIFVCGTMIVMFNLGMVLCGVFLVNPSAHSLLLSCVTYVWLRSLKNSVINFMGVVPIKAYYLPFFNAALSVMSAGENFLDVLVGITAGYLYQCIQSDTLPLYNLISGVYGRFDPAQDSGRRVGTGIRSVTDNSDTFHDAIFDKGYLKAPTWLYKCLNYPLNRSKRTTAFSETPPHTVVHTTSTTFAKGTAEEPEGNVFRGRGHRLGD